MTLPALRLIPPPHWKWSTLAEWVEALAPALVVAQLQERSLAVEVDSGPPGWWSGIFVEGLLPLPCDGSDFSPAWPGTDGDFEAAWTAARESSLIAAAVTCEEFVRRCEAILDLNERQVFLELLPNHVRARSNSLGVSHVGFGLSGALPSASDALNERALRDRVRTRWMEGQFTRLQVLDEDPSRRSRWLAWATSLGIHASAPAIEAAGRAPLSRVRNELQALAAMSDCAEVLTPAPCPLARFTDRFARRLPVGPLAGPPTCGSSELSRHFPRVVAVTLDEATQRQAALQAHLDDSGMPFAFRRFARPTRESLREEDWAHCEAYGRPELKQSEAYRLGAVGCRQSHAAVIREALEQGWSHVLVLEDDARPLADAGALLLQAARQLPEDWEMLFFFTSGGSGPPVGPGLFEALRARSTLAFVVRRSAYARLLDWWRTSGCEADLFERFLGPSRVKAYRTVPYLFVEETRFPSEIGRGSSPPGPAPASVKAHG